MSKFIIFVGWISIIRSIIIQYTLIRVKICENKRKNSIVKMVILEDWNRNTLVKMVFLNKFYEKMFTGSHLIINLSFTRS